MERSGWLRIVILRGNIPKLELDISLITARDQESRELTAQTNLVDGEIMHIEQCVLQRTESKLATAEPTSVHDYLEVELVDLDFALFPAGHCYKEFPHLILWLFLSIGFRLAHAHGSNLLPSI